MEYGEKIELMRSEVHRLVKEYNNSKLCWHEMVEYIRTDGDTVQ